METWDEICRNNFKAAAGSYVIDFNTITHLVLHQLKLYCRKKRAHGEMRGAPRDWGPMPKQRVEWTRAPLTLLPSGMMTKCMRALWTCLTHFNTLSLQFSSSDPTAALLSILWSSIAQAFVDHDSSDCVREVTVLLYDLNSPHSGFHRLPKKQILYSDFAK